MTCPTTTIATPQLPTTGLPETKFVVADCGFEPPASAEVQCGWLEVPENRNSPENSRPLRLHVAVYASTAPDPEPDPVLYLFGGPGDPSLDISTFFYGDLVLPLTERRDVIVVDHRGTGYTGPSLTCPEGIAAAFDVLDEDITAEDADQRVIAGYAACRQRLIAAGVDLSAYGTAQNAADIVAVMDALGYELYNLFGVSYGSRVALTVLRDRPEQIRSMVLDGVYPLEVDPVSEEAENAAAAIEALFQECATNSTCVSEYPDLEGTFWELVDRLDATPVTISAFPAQGGSSHDAIVDGDFLIQAVVLALSLNDLVPEIPRAIDGAANGDDAALKVFVDDVFGTLDEDYPVGLGYSVFCHEEVPFADLDAREVALQQAGRVGDALRHSVLHLLAGLLAVPARDVVAFCDTMQAGQAAEAEDQPISSEVPVLMLQGQLDYATPTRWAHQAAASLPNAAVVEFPGRSHWTTINESCALDIAYQFIADPDATPDSSCIDGMPPVRFR